MTHDYLVSTWGTDSVRLIMNTKQNNPPEAIRAPGHYKLLNRLDLFLFCLRPRVITWVFKSRREIRGQARSEAAVPAVLWIHHVVGGTV